MLLGPTGSGKSHLGRLLHARGLAHFEELEPLLMTQFGTGADFAARKAEALEFIEASYRRQLGQSTLPVALQATGLSDRAIQERIGRDFRLLLARINTPRQLCAARAQSRPAGQNLNNDPEYAASFHDYWQANVAPGWNFALELDGTDSEAALTLIGTALS